MMRHHQIKVSAPAIFKDRDLLRIPAPPTVSGTLRDQVIQVTQNTVRMNRSAGEGYHQLTNMLDSGVATIDMKGPLLQRVVVSFPHVNRVGSDQIHMSASREPVTLQHRCF
jgi:hypothetical protein